MWAEESDLLTAERFSIALNELFVAFLVNRL